MTWLRELAEEFNVPLARIKQQSTKVSNGTIKKATADVPYDEIETLLSKPGHQDQDQDNIFQEIGAALMELGVPEYKCTIASLKMRRFYSLHRRLITEDLILPQVAQAIADCQWTGLDFIGPLQKESKAREFARFDQRIDNPAAVAEVFQSSIEQGEAMLVVHKCFRGLLAKPVSTEQKQFLLVALHATAQLFCSFEFVKDTDGKLNWPVVLNLNVHPAQFKTAITREAGAVCENSPDPEKSDQFALPEGAVPYVAYSANNDAELLHVAEHIRSADLEGRSLNHPQQHDMSSEIDVVGPVEEVMLSRVNELVESRYYDSEPIFLFTDTSGSPDKPDLAYGDSFVSGLREYLPALPAYSTTASSKDGPKLAYKGFDALNDIARQLLRKTPIDAQGLPVSNIQLVEMAKALENYSPELALACESAAKEGLSFPAKVKLAADIVKLGNDATKLPVGMDKSIETITSWLPWAEQALTTSN